MLGIDFQGLPHQCGGLQRLLGASSVAWGHACVKTYSIPTAAGDGQRLGMCQTKGGYSRVLQLIRCSRLTVL